MWLGAHLVCVRSVCGQAALRHLSEHMRKNHSNIQKEFNSMDKNCSKASRHTHPSSRQVAHVWLTLWSAPGAHAG